MIGDAVVTFHPELAGGDSQRESDDWCDNAVVESTFHMECATQTRGDPAIVDHLCAESGVGRSQRGAHEARECPGEIVEEPGGQE